MNRHRHRQTFAAVLVIALGFAAVYFISRFLQENAPPPVADLEDAGTVVQTVKLKGYALGFEGLIADWYWMKSLQYIGDKIFTNKQNLDLENLSALDPRLLYPYLDAATTLDPRFTEVYSYGAVVLPAINPEQAIKLTEKGIADNPDEWRLYQHLGYIYWRLENYDKAADAYARGAAVENAPPFMRMMQARMKNQGSDRETARAIYEQMYREADDDQTKESAQIRLLELDSLDERDAIRAALQSFRAKTDRCATGWQEILPLLRTVKLPGGQNFRLDKSNNLIDPTGAPYLLDAPSCDVKLNSAKTKIPVETKKNQL